MDGYDALLTWAKGYNMRFTRFEMESFIVLIIATLMLLISRMTP